MEKFEVPTVEVIELSDVSVICTSGCTTMAEYETDWEDG